MINQPSPSLLREALRYEASTGKLYWRHRPSMRPQWNATYPGREAFTAKQKGYNVGGINNRTFLAHRVIWAMMNDKWPEEHIDHINGDTSDNRLVNLREATNAENMWNQGKPITNSSGYKGVTWNRDRRKWMAQIGFNKHHKYLGLFDCRKAAYAVYIDAVAKYHGEYGRYV